MKNDKVSELVEKLDQYETYDKENLLIDIYVSLIEEKYDIDDTLFAFIELSALRDATLADGSDSFFDTFDAEEYRLRILPILDDEIQTVFSLGEEERYEEIDQWMIDNEWKYNDFLSKIIKSKWNM